MNKEKVKFYPLPVMVDFFVNGKKFIKINESAYHGGYVNCAEYETGFLKYCGSKYVEIETKPEVKS